MRKLLKLDSDEFRKHEGIRMIVFSYLTGSDLFQKIALLNKTTRQMLHESGILKQVKVLTMKSVPSYLGNLNFGLSLADVIELVAT